MPSIALPITTQTMLIPVNSVTASAAAQTI